MDPRIKLALCASAAVWMGTGAAIVFEISFKPELKRLFGHPQNDKKKKEKENSNKQENEEDRKK